MKIYRLFKNNSEHLIGVSKNKKPQKGELVYDYQKQEGLLYGERKKIGFKKRAKEVKINEFEVDKNVLILLKRDNKKC